MQYGHERYETTSTTNNTTKRATMTGTDKLKHYVDDACDGTKRNIFEQHLRRRLLPITLPCVWKFVRLIITAYSTTTLTSRLLLFPLIFCFLLLHLFQCSPRLGSSSSSCCCYCCLLQHECLSCFFFNDSHSNRFKSWSMSSCVVGVYVE